MRDGNSIFDINKYYDNRKRYSKFISKIINIDEKRIRDDKNERFEKELKNSLENIKNIMIREGYLKEDGQLSEQSLRLYAKEIIGDIEKEISGIFEYGKFYSNNIGKDEYLFGKNFGIGDKYNEIDIKNTIREYIKNRDIKFIVEKKRENKGGKYIILLDISGSMIGKKIYEAKKALIVLIEKILIDNNAVDLILFNDKSIKKYYNINKIENIIDILKLVPNGSTDIASTLYEVYNDIDSFSHIIIITDALPTYGEKPIDRTLEITKIISNKAYISIIGIGLNQEGERIAKLITKYGNGRLFITKNIEDLKKLVLIEYELSKL
ncbi:magnesium chelatase [Nanobdella aerobiophila]|uniref:Magnesium chelatase n=1 Tax=Nanobdella aerobiophila TaxID=2586965 RepID=A0A915SFN1_9ARCH|nr:vWA domain-containing protein [Nanobdella aerobiophila]BBL45885.1 magnesium chelatase [Nanobdella aerobiophila]